MRYKDIRILRSWEDYDYFQPRLPQFYRHRILFFAWIYDKKAEQDFSRADGLLLKSTDKELEDLYLEFYNSTRYGTEHPVTREQVLLRDMDTTPLKDSKEDYREYLDHLGGKNLTEKILDEWIKELMA